MLSLEELRHEKYKVKVLFTRRHSIPDNLKDENGDCDYNTTNLAYYFSYGKGKEYKSSKNAVNDLYKLCYPFQGYFTEIKILIFRHSKSKLIKTIRSPLWDSLWGSNEKIDSKFCEKILNRCYEEWPYCDTPKNALV